MYLKVSLRVNCRGSQCTHTITHTQQYLYEVVEVFTNIITWSFHNMHQILTWYVLSLHNDHVDYVSVKPEKQKDNLKTKNCWELTFILSLTGLDPALYRRAGTINLFHKQVKTIVRHFVENVFSWKHPESIWLVVWMIRGFSAVKLGAWIYNNQGEQPWARSLLYSLLLVHHAGRIKVALYSHWYSSIIGKVCP